MNEKTKKITIIGMLCAVSYLVMMVGRVPLVPAVSFLKYDPKDVIIVIGGFIFGPMVSFLISLIVSVVEMLSVSETGIIGLIMNVIATCSFACIAAFVYKKKHTMSGAILGLGLGIICMTAVMLLWNYFITPIYMGYPREAVVELLLPAFLPFNLIKGGINLGITLLVYKPIVTALRKAHLIHESENTDKKSTYIGTIVVSSFILVSCILFVLVMKGTI
ncbi:MAG: ECF transporter S component [Lachnospiraceae bacterium]|jgi:riboflavin transporter FmnP|nr:ECF transporter S component [Lachnospiraceae bacterium]